MRETTFENEAHESLRPKLWERLVVIVGTVFLALGLGAGLAQAGDKPPPMPTDPYETPFGSDRGYLLDPNSPYYDPDLWDELYGQAKGNENEYKPRANIDDTSAPLGVLDIGGLLHLAAGDDDNGDMSAESLAILNAFIDPEGWASIVGDGQD